MKYVFCSVLLIFIANTANSNELWDSIKEGASNVVDKSSEVITNTTNKVKDSMSDDEDHKSPDEKEHDPKEIDKPIETKQSTNTNKVVTNDIGNIEDWQIRENNNFSINFNLAPVNFPFPLAWGVNGHYIASKNWMFGIDYLSSGKSLKLFSFEIGEIKEQNITLQAKRFFGNSFNIIMGVGQRSTEVKFAKNLFDLAVNNYSETAAEFRTRYIRLGIGNQWHFKKKYTLAVNWLSIDIPFSGEVVTSASQYAKSADAKEDIEDSESILKYYPNGGVVKFEIGMVF